MKVKAGRFLYRDHLSYFRDQTKLIIFKKNIANIKLNGRNRLVIEQAEQKEMDELEESSVWGVPVCGANLSSPVVDQTLFISEIHYKIGERLYIENAD